jgi:DNA-binding MarR family transcriptional regulator
MHADAGEVAGQLPKALANECPRRRRLPFEDCDAVARVGRAVVDPVSADVDVHAQRLRELQGERDIEGAVSEARGMTVKVLAERIAMHETTLIRNLRILEREGWIALAIGADNRRQRIPSLTRQGRAVFAKALVGWMKAQSAVAGVIDERLADAARRLVRLRRAVWLGRRPRRATSCGVDSQIFTARPSEPHPA